MDLGFIRGQTNVVELTFAFLSCFGGESLAEIKTDASILGIGGLVSVNGGPVACFSGVITPEDEEVLQVTRGDIKGQQSFEGLALLVAVQLWSNLWCARRVRLILRSDNVGVLSIYFAVKGRGEGMNLIAREYALDIRECSYEPDVIEDIPGITSQCI